MIEKFTVSRDDSVYEAWPDVAKAADGSLVCVFTECDHHGDRTHSRIVYVKSVDNGRTWSKKRPLTEYSDKAFFYNNARISLLNSGKLYVCCDKAYADESGSEIYLWESSDNGETWSKPMLTPCFGIVPSKLTELKYGEHKGRWLIVAHTRNKENLYTVRSRYSDDNGKTWSEEVIVAEDSRYQLCEAAPLELKNGEIVVLLRENSGRGLDVFKTFSHDGGATYEGLYNAPIPACHRPVAAYIGDDTVMVTFRFMQGGKGWLGSWTQNVFAAFMSDKDLAETERRNQSTRIMPLDYDRSPVSDLGYTGFVTLDNGEIYVVNYIVDDAPKAQIRGYAFTMQDVVLK